MDARGKRTADPEADLNRLRRRGVWVEAVSMAWTLAVAVAAIAAGIVASSIALIGLGLESAIRLLVAAIVVWQLSDGRDAGENRVAGLIAVMFLAGAAYLAAESIHELASHQQSAHSVVGLVISSAALVVLAVLALTKRRVGQALGSGALLAHAAETGLSALAAAAALLGVGLDDWLGWWWTVPAGGLAIAALAVIEGIHVAAPRQMVILALPVLPSKRSVSASSYSRARGRSRCREQGMDDGPSWSSLDGHP